MLESMAQNMESTVLLYILWGSRIFWLVFVPEQTGLSLILWQMPVIFFSH